MIAIWILCGVFLVGSVAAYVFSDDLPERWRDAKDFSRLLVYLPRLLREAEAFAKQQEATPEEESTLSEQDLKNLAVKREDIRARWLIGGGTEEAFDAVYEGLHKRGWLVKRKGPGELREITWGAYLGREGQGVGVEERLFLESMVRCIEEKKQRSLLEKMDRASGIRSSRVIDKMVRVKEEELSAILRNIGLDEKRGERFLKQLSRRGILGKVQGSGNQKNLFLQKARDLLQQERRFLWTSLGLGVAAILPLGLMYVPLLVGALSQIAPPVALLAGVVLGSYVELSHRLEMQRSALRIGVLRERTTVQGNTLQPIFIGLLLGQIQYRSSYGWGIPHKEKGWLLRTLKLELLMKIRVYVLAILLVLLVLLLSSWFARDSELMASLNPFIGYYTLLISFAMWSSVNRRGKLPVLRAKVLLYHPDKDLGKGWLASVFEEPQTDKFLSKEEFLALQQSCSDLRMEKPLFLEVTAWKSDYGFYNQTPSFRLFQRGMEKMALDESDEAYRLLNERYGLKKTKDAGGAGGVEETEDLLAEDAEL